MQTVFSPLVTMYQTQLEVSKRCADVVFSGTERIDRVMIGATQRAFNDQLDLVQAITSFRDPQSAGNTLQSKFLSRTPDEALGYQTEIMRIIAEMQNDIGKSLRDYVNELGTNAMGSGTIAREHVRAQPSDTAFNPMTSMFSVWESAFKEVASLTKKNMMVARSTVEDATSKAMQRASGGGTGEVAIASVSATESDETIEGDKSGSPTASGSRKK
jgi:hypothetical protein